MLNRIVTIGRLTRDPEKRTTPNGVAVTTFTIACDRDFKNAGGEKETDFIPVVTWRGLAESCGKYLAKGKMAAVEGRLQIRTVNPCLARKCRRRKIFRFKEGRH